MNIRGPETLVPFDAACGVAQDRLRQAQDEGFYCTRVSVALILSLSKDEGAR
jgi:hypothetical protein